MNQLKIVGGTPLRGVLPISGAKNAALPLMIASVLNEHPLTLTNVPCLADVRQLQTLLTHLGVTCDAVPPDTAAGSGQGLRLHAAKINTTTAPYDLVSTMRASFWVIGPLLARCGRARVSLPGGCAIGTRPVDLFLMALERMGAVLHFDGGYVEASAPHGLHGARIRFPKVTVGATHVALMAAVLAKGESVIENAACEPEIVDLAACLMAMGARIEGAGTPILRVQGGAALRAATHSVLPDRIETGTFAFAVAMAGGAVDLQGARADLLRLPLELLRACGVGIEMTANAVRVTHDGAPVEPRDIATAPYPGFPTDLQAQWMALMTRARGVSRLRETIFENRFMHVQELARLGACISLAGDVATVTGVAKLVGAPVMATDLRASVSLVIAALAAQGETTISRIYHLDRGFERLEHKLRACGAQVERVMVPKGAPADLALENNREAQ